MRTGAESGDKQRRADHRPRRHVVGVCQNGQANTCVDDIHGDIAIQSIALPPVVLSDAHRFHGERTEFDKADIEFPNDLLREIDRMEFYVYETRELVKARHRPIIIITSNNEKELPDAFLRRCFFHYIRFPDAETMEKIVAVHYPNLKKDLLAEALGAFYKVRETPGLKKKPSTSELLDWIKLLLAEDIPPEALRSDDPKKAIPPLYGALLKNEQDVHLFEQLIFLNRRAR